ncbi:YhjD/YihY/BrkB family envelope integrity protein [Roseateles sp. PN1]|uniref:YhjD/YihY/BrkB family envelope integrity protein n=1 Tax=Roseateles sp. PN1 TaxID=3137372 RepID=UPI0040545213
MFALIYKIIPRVHIAWRDVWIGAWVTALLFNFGKLLIGLYIGKSGVASAFGAAGSLARWPCFCFGSTTRPRFSSSVLNSPGPTRTALAPSATLRPGRTRCRSRPARLALCPAPFRPCPKGAWIALLLTPAARQAQLPRSRTTEGLPAQAANPSPLSVHVLALQTGPPSGIRRQYWPSATPSGMDGLIG